MPSPVSANYLPLRAVQDWETVVASGTRTTDGNGSGVFLPRAPNGWIFILDVTAAGTDAGDTLDAGVDALFPCGGTDVWVRICSFTQLAGNGGVKRYIGKCNLTGDEAMFEASAGLAAGSTRDLMGDQVRGSWAIADSGNGNSSYTFAIYAWPV